MGHGIERGGGPWDRGLKEEGVQGLGIAGGGGPWDRGLKEEGVHVIRD